MKLKAFPKTVQNTSLVEIKSGKVICNTLQLAAKFEKNHFDVLRALQNIECSQVFRDSNFEVSSYQSFQGKSMPMYEMTRDGFTFLAMGFTGKEAAKWKEKYIMAFNMMEEELLKSEFTPSIKPASAQGMVLLDQIPKIVTAFECFLKASSALGCDRNSSAITANQSCFTLTGVNLLEIMGQTHLVAEKQELFFTPTELGKNLGISGMAFNKKLEAAGFQNRYNDVWNPTNEGKVFCKILDTGKNRKSGVPISQVKWSQEVTRRI